MVKIKDLKQGDKFKLSEDSNDVYTIVNDLKGAKCNNDCYTNYFNENKEVIKIK